MNREELEFLAEDDRADGEDYNVDISLRFCSATCACGFESHGCPFHDPVQVLPARHVTFAASYDDEGYSCDDFTDERLPTVPSVTDGMMRAALRARRP